MDVFSGWDSYAERLEKNWQERVSPGDTVIIPGDVSWAMSLEGALEDFRFIDRLNGRKIISKGNHDYWWNTKSKTDAFFAENGITTVEILHNNFYEREGVGICGTRGWINDGSEPQDQKLILREAQRLERSVSGAVEAGLEPIVFLHYPPVYMDDVNGEITSVMQKYGVKLCFYGHLHGYAHKNAVIGNRDGIEYRLISSDFLHFCPYDITNIVKNHEK